MPSSTAQRAAPSPVFHVQPIVDLATGRPIGVEALLRHPQTDGRWLGPATAQDDPTHDITPAMVGQVLGTVDAIDPQLMVSFNLPPALVGGSGPAWLADCDPSARPGKIVLELLEHPAPGIDLTAGLTALRARGFHLALDDFGTRHANLDRLRDLPIEIVKLDRSFLASGPQDRRTRAILAALRALTDALDCVLIAEGVETPAQRQHLQALGLRYAQGFLLGPPQPLAVWASAPNDPA